jgi:hypothetical protein
MTSMKIAALYAFTAALFGLTIFVVHLGYAASAAWLGGMTASAAIWADNARAERKDRRA